MVACVAAEYGERDIHLQFSAGGDDTLGLFQDDAAVQCVLELGVDGGAVAGVLVVDDGDAGDVDQSLGEGEVCVVEMPHPFAEQADGAQSMLSQPLSLFGGVLH